MREIKFRAKTKSGHVAYQGTPDLENIQSFFHHFGDEDDLLEQFTGLYDLNGNEIYENDIVTWNDGDVINPSVRIAKVVWGHGQWTFEITENSPTMTKGYVFKFGTFAYQKTEDHLEIIS